MALFWDERHKMHLLEYSCCKAPDSLTSDLIPRAKDATAATINIIKVKSWQASQRNRFNQKTNLEND